MSTKKTTGADAGKKTVRCAVYTRKSTDEGLEQSFNSLDAQRESGESYVASMKHEGWQALPERYDDGGYTGANTERPALKRLLAAIDAGKVDVVVCYKLDRLSRSLADFARLMESFEKKGVSFVSVTQQFNSTTSMGRLTVNILMSFAQFERELTSERTRDKIAMSRQRGKWAGGRPVLGYDIEPGTRRLIVNEAEAAQVRTIFETYLKTGSLIQTARDVNARGWTNKLAVTAQGRRWGGRPFDKSNLHLLLTNVVYIGKVRHKDQVYDGEHPAVIEPAVFSEVQRRLATNAAAGGQHVRNRHGALLKGLLVCGPCERAMTHTTTVKDKTRVYRYYTCQAAQKGGSGACPCGSLPAEQIEGFVLERVRALVQDPEVRSATLAAARAGVEDRAGALREGLARLRRDREHLEDDVRHAAAAGPSQAARLGDLHRRAGEMDADITRVGAELAGLENGLATRAEVDGALAEFAGAWGCLGPREQAHVVRLLVARVEYDNEGGNVSIGFHDAGLRAVARMQRGEAA